MGEVNKKSGRLEDTQFYPNARLSLHRFGTNWMKLKQEFHLLLHQFRVFLHGIDTNCFDAPMVPSGDIKRIFPTADELLFIFRLAG